MYLGVIMNFESIIQEIQQESSCFMSNEQKENLIKIVSYVSSHIQHNNTQSLVISLKEIKKITGCDDENVVKVFADVGFYLCGTRWGILKLVYHYSYYDKNTMHHHLIELTEDEIAQANETGLLDNQELKGLFNNNPVYYNPKEIHITLRLSDKCKTLYN